MLLAGYGKKPDYEKVFQLFDDNNNGQISGDEFKSMLIRWKLLGPAITINNFPEKELQMLVDLIDRTKKGFIDYQDLLKFMEVDKYSNDNKIGMYECLCMDVFNLTIIIFNVVKL